MRRAEHSATTVGMVELTIEQLSMTVDCSFLAREVRGRVRVREEEDKCLWQQHFPLGGLWWGQLGHRLNLFVAFFIFDHN